VVVILDVPGTNGLSVGEPPGDTTLIGLLESRVLPFGYVAWRVHVIGRKGTSGTCKGYDKDWVLMLETSGHDGDCSHVAYKSNDWGSPWEDFQETSSVSPGETVGGVLSNLRAWTV